MDMDDMMNEDEPADNIFDKFVSKDGDADMADVDYNEKVRKYDLSITYDFFH